MSVGRVLLYRAAWLAALTGAGVAGAAPPSQAGDLRLTVEKPHFTCEGSATLRARVAYHPGRQPVPGPVLPCCDGKLRCAQFLSTSTVVHSGRQWRG